MHEAPPVTQWLLRCTGGLHRIHLPVGVIRAASDRRPGHALNPVSHATGSTLVRTPPRRRGGPRDPAAAGHRDGCGSLGRLQLPARPGGAPRLWRLSGRRRRHGPRARGRHGCLPGPAAPVRARRGAARGRGPGTPPGPAPPHRNGVASWRTAHRRRYTGRLTGFRAHARCFSANFSPLCITRSNHPPTPVRPARKGPPGTCAPYVDWPPRQGALPCTPHECNAS